MRSRSLLLAAAILAPGCDGSTGPSETGPAAIVLGSYVSCRLTEVRRAYCWGRNTGGAVGDGTTTNRLTPVAVAMAIRFEAMTANEWQTCGLTGEGVAYCWGGNYWGQLGDGTTSGRSTPVPVAVPGGLRFASLEAGGEFTCGLTAAGAAWCWGRNDEGQLGNGSTIESRAPVPVAMPAGVSFVALSAGWTHACGLTAAGAVWCWGSNAWGQAGNGTSLTTQLVPGPVTMPGERRFVSMVAGIFHSCAIEQTGGVYCWGDNRFGQQGDGTLVPRLTPGPAELPAGFVATGLAAGAFHLCAVAATGAPQCWGLNAMGQLGDGTETDRYLPVPVAMPADIRFGVLAAGGWHTCGMSQLGTMYCWGYNRYGQVGDGTTTNRSFPVVVAWSGSGAD